MTRLRTKFSFAGILLILVSVSGIAQTWNLDMAEALFSRFSENDYLAAGIVQNGQFFPVRNREIELDHAPFAIVVLFYGADGILVNATTDSLFYNGIRKGKDVDEILAEPEMFMGMAEGLFNDTRSLLLTRTAAHYWYFSDIFDHRFDFIQSYPGHVIGYRWIDFLQDIDGDSWAGEQSVITPGELNQPLYLSFFYQYWQDGSRVYLQSETAKLVLR